MTTFPSTARMPGRSWQPLSRRRSILARRILLLIAVTWVPMCLFAIAQGVAMRPSPRGSFLLDFATYARFFVALPILVVGDAIIRPHLADAAERFVDNGFIRPTDLGAFDEAKARLAKRQGSWIAKSIIAGIAGFGAWRLTFEAVSGVSADSWQSVDLAASHAIRWSLAAIWNHVVAVPLFLYLTYRWLWRIVAWTLFLFDVARLDLRLTPTHADRSGGLGFLEDAHAFFGSLAFAASSVISAEAAFRIVYEGARIQTFQVPLLSVLVVTQLVFLGPLLVFCPTLFRHRRIGVTSYGVLVSRYNRAFHRKWIEGRRVDGDELLGAPDIQSLADLGNSFRFVSEMRLVPFGRRGVGQLVLATVLPVLPVLLLAVPMDEFVHVVTSAVF